jgi:hypothetical protein
VSSPSVGESAWQRMPRSGVRCGPALTALLVVVIAVAEDIIEMVTLPRTAPYTPALLEDTMSSGAARGQGGASIPSGSALAES